MKAIFSREIRAYFTTPVGYIFIGMFLVASGFMFAYVNLLNRSPRLDGVLSNLIPIFMFLIPILTMRLLSEERNMKTDQILITSPVSVWEIVLGKYFAAVCVYLITLALTLIYLVVIGIHGKPAYAEILCSYVGFSLLGMCFISVGVFISSLTENQAVAAVTTFIILLVLYIMDWLTTLTNMPWLVKFVEWFSITQRYADFELGILNLSPVIYYLSFVFVFLFLTVSSVERRRWN